MNKKFIVFICILSLLVPFLPQFDFVVLAEGLPNVSNDNLDEWREWLEEHGMMQDPQTGQPVPISNNPLSLAINKFLLDNGYVVKDDFSIIVDSLQSITGINILQHGGLDSLKDYVEQNNYESLSQNIVNYSITYANDNLGYYIYNAMPVDDFFNFYNFSGLNSQWLTPTTNFINYLKNNICVSENTLYIMCTDVSNMRLNDGSGVVGKLSFDVLNEYSFYLDSGNFGDFPNYQYQSMIFPISGVDSVDFSGRLKLSNGESLFSSYGKGWYRKGIRLTAGQKQSTTPARFTKNIIRGKIVLNTT